MENPTTSAISPNGHGQKDLRTTWMAKPALVCDLDGTLRYNKDDPEGFINSAEEIALYDHVIEALWGYRRDGYIIAIVTNQGGFAYGHLDQATWDRQNGRMHELAEERHEDGWPVHMTLPAKCMAGGSKALYAYASLRRKPSSGMLAVLEHQAELNNVRIKWDESYFIGDRPEDEEVVRHANRNLEGAEITFVTAADWRHQLALKYGDGDEAGGGADE